MEDGSGVEPSGLARGIPYPRVDQEGPRGKVSDYAIDPE